MAYRDDDEARSAFEAAAARRSLPMLGRMEIASPCSMKWSEMDGDDRRRFCGKCKKHVYYLSGMTADEAERFLLERDGVACVRYFQRADGTILLADCTIGRRNKRVVRIAAATAALALAGGGAAHFYEPESSPYDAWTQDMGDISEVEDLPPDPGSVDNHFTGVLGGVSAFDRADLLDPPLIDPPPTHPRQPEPEISFLPSDGTFQSTPRRK
jgi:hypothetical protein